MADEDYDVLYKLVVMGVAGCGKSAFVQAFTQGQAHIPAPYVSTIGVDFAIRNVTVNDSLARLQIWDTSGQERFRAIINSYFRGAAGVILVYSVTDMASLEFFETEITAIREMCNPNARFMLVGLKADLDAERVVSLDEGREMADRIGVGLHMAISSTNLADVEASVAMLVQDLMDNSGEAIKKRLPGIGGEAVRTPDSLRDQCIKVVGDNLLTTYEEAEFVPDDVLGRLMNYVAGKQDFGNRHLAWFTRFPLQEFAISTLTRGADHAEALLLLSGCPTITVLNLADAHDEKVNEVVVEALMGLTSLRSLAVKGCHLGHFLPLLAAAEHLSALEISNSDNIDDAHFEALSKLETATRLRSLVISGRLRKRGLLAIKRFTRLESLTIGQNADFSDAVLQCLFDDEFAALDARTRAVVPFNVTAQGRDQFPVPMHFLLTATQYAATHNCLAGVRHDAVRIEHEGRIFEFKDISLAEGAREEEMFAGVDMLLLICDAVEYARTGSPLPSAEDVPGGASVSVMVHPSYKPELADADAVDAEVLAAANPTLDIFTAEFTDDGIRSVLDHIALATGSDAEALPCFAGMNHLALSATAVSSASVDFLAEIPNLQMLAVSEGANVSTAALEALAVRATEMGFTLVTAPDTVELKVLMLGLDASGKTTVLYKLKLGEIVATIPTIGFNTETVTYKKTDFVFWDIGGQLPIRPLWRHYFAETGAIIWVVDSNDRERMDECQEELDRVLQENLGVPLLVLANKQDLPNAQSVAEVVDKLRLHSIRARMWYIQGVCATTGDGLYEGLDWLAQAGNK